MKNTNGILKILIVANISILICMLLYCYRHIFTEIPGECDECSVGASISYYIGTVFMTIQMIAATIMCCFIPFYKQKRLWVYVSTGLIAVGGILCSVMQFVAFSIELMFDSHGDFTEESYMIIEAIELEFKVATVMSIVLLALNLVLLTLGVCAIINWVKDKKKEDIYWSIK